jgi:Na+-transporting NADH:ubiquinone oxidoreductase subunit NqrC
MVDADFIAVLTPSLTVLVAMSALGGVIVKGVTWLNKKQDEKAALLKKQTEEYAGNLKTQAEGVAANLKTNNEMIAIALAKVATDTALTLKENNERIATSLKDNNAQVSLLISTSLRETHVKLNDLACSFKERGDFSNGYVAAIRSEIQDFKEDFYAREDVGDDNDSNYAPSPQRRARKRLVISRNRNSANTRRSIERDRVKQDHR